uniref:Uncharacterized protein n=1 Tax=Siphoviridae sp. ctoNj20 TaxID=2826085 RepID=A0A8D9UH83_9CAUD|nr:MAG TPA: hypothetical protein [Siphoviridae sp. ctoNj20]
MWASLAVGDDPRDRNQLRIHDTRPLSSSSQLSIRRRTHVGTTDLRQRVAEAIGVQSLTQAGRQDVVTTIGQDSTVGLHGSIHGGLSELNRTSTKQVSSVILRSSVLLIGCHRNTVVDDNGITIPVRNVDRTLDTRGIGVLAELQKILLRQVQGNLGMHDGHAEDTGIIAHSLLHSLCSGSLANHIGFAGRTRGRSKRNVGGMQRPRIVPRDTKDTVHDTDQTILTLLVPVLRNLGRNLLHGVSTRVEVTDEVLITPRVHTTIDDTRLGATGRIGNSHIGSAVVVVIRTTQNIVERDSIEVGAVSDHTGDLRITLHSTAVDHSGTRRILCSTPVHQKDLFIEGITEKSTRH